MENPIPVRTNVFDLNHTKKGRDNVSALNRSYRRNQAVAFCRFAIVFAMFGSFVVQP